MKIVIIGGVAGGATAAARLRRLDETAEIVLLERSGYISYANCGLPYYVGGVITDPAALTLQTPESFYRRFRIDVRVGNEALGIDRAAKTVRIRRLRDGSEYTESYDKLILSPGAQPLRPDVPGIRSSRIATLRTVEDCLALRALTEKAAGRRAVVVGGGFIGLEAAENLLHAGVSTTLLQRSGQALPPLDLDMACQVHGYLRDRGLDLRLNTAVSGYEDTPEGVRVLLKDGCALEADFVLLAVGVAPDSELARTAGLALGVKGAIAVNEHMQTSDPDVYAVGDAVQITQFVSGAKAVISLAGPANRQGRAAADHICAQPGSYTGALASSVVKLFSMTAASTGLSEKAARAAGIDCRAVIITAASHATYYPGASDLTVKVVFAPETGRVLGAQIVGYEGVDKRIDVFAAAIRAGLTAGDLQQLDLSYAPPYSSAKDPVNVAGAAIENLRQGLVRQFSWEDIPAIVRDENALILDVRTPGEFADGHLTGAINIPLDDLRGRLGELDPFQRLYVICHSGLRSYLACRILSQNGFDCLHLSGGYGFYQSVMQNKAPAPNAAYPCGQPQTAD